MSPSEVSTSAASTDLANGAGAAAILAAGIGTFALALLAIAGDQVKGFGKMMIFYKPTGPLSGVTTGAVVVWLGVWAILNRRWGKRTVALGRIATISLVLLALSLLLTFPPFAGLL